MASEATESETAAAASGGAATAYCESETTYEENRECEFCKKKIKVSVGEVVVLTDETDSCKVCYETVSDKLRGHECAENEISLGYFEEDPNPDEEAAATGVSEVKEYEFVYYADISFSFPRSVTVKANSEESAKEIFDTKTVKEWDAFNFEQGFIDGPDFSNPIAVTYELHDGPILVEQETAEAGGAAEDSDHPQCEHCGRMSEDHTKQFICGECEVCYFCNNTGNRTSGCPCRVADEESPGEEERRQDLRASHADEM